jgi:hypothetical protein
LPTFYSLTIPSAPDIDIPDFDLPDIDLNYQISEPNEFDFHVGTMSLWGDSLMLDMKNKLRENLQGGTGLSETVENAIWEREKEREERRLSDSTDKLISVWATKGFSLPDGLLAYSLAGLQNEYLNQSLTRARDIAIKQADLEQSNLFKTLEISSAIANILADLMYHYEELVFKGQEAVAKYANEYIGLQIQIYKARAEVYKAIIEASHIAVQRQLAIVEIYKAKIEAQKAIGEINKVLVERYEAQVRAAVAKIEAYRAQVEGCRAQAEVEKARVEASLAAVQAYEVSSRASIESYKGQVECYKANVGAVAAQYELATKATEATLRANIAVYEAAIKNYEAQQSNVIQVAQMQLQAMMAAAQAASSLAAGAMSALSAQGAISYSESMALLEA